jgi:HEPN superfamily AbiU2-like protein
LEFEIAQYAVFPPSGKDEALIDRVDRMPAGGMFAFNVVSESLHQNLIASLCRIWDTHGDAVHISKLATKLKRNPSLVGDAGALHKWLARVDEIEKWQPLVTMREYRNIGLSHTIDRTKRVKARKHGVVHGDEPRVLEATIEVLIAFDRLLGINDRAPANIWHADFVGYARDFFGASPKWGKCQQSNGGNEGQ